MALSDSKIAGLRALAARGIGGEKDNAIRILKANNIPLVEPAAKKQSGPTPNYQSGGFGPFTEFNVFDFGEMFNDSKWEEMWVGGKRQTKPPPRREAPKMIMSSINSEFLANIVFIIATRLYGSDGDCVWNSHKQIVVFRSPKMTLERMQTINAATKKNEKHLTDIALKAMQNAPLI